MRDKVELTKQLLKLLPNGQQKNIKIVLAQWWCNIRKNGGMRLTGTGYITFIKDIDLEHYEFVIHDPLILNQQLILDMDRKLDMPYYIHAVKGIPKKIVFFGSRDAVMVNLYGNLKKFLDNY